MNEENTFYGKGADNLTRGYGVILLIAYIRETILDYDLKLTIGDKVFNLNFFVLGFVCLSVMIFAIIISKKG